MNAMLTCAHQFDLGQVLERLHAYKVRDTIQKVTRSAPEEFPAIGEERYHVAMMDYGVKQNMIDCLRRRGCSVTALPAFSSDSELVTIDGSYNQLEKLDALEGLKMLNKVLMDYNAEISSVNGLSSCPALYLVSVYGTKVVNADTRSEERRVGKECRSRWSPYH